MKANDVNYEKTKNNDINHDSNKNVNVQISVPNENNSHDTNDKIRKEKNMLLTRNDCVIKVISLLYWLRTLLINWCPSFVIESVLSTLHVDIVSKNKNDDGSNDGSNIYGISKLSDSSKAVLTARTASLLVERYAFLFKF